ncbi:MAG: M14 family zinc carboxypeptidase [Bacteroidota bacterium]
MNRTDCLENHSLYKEEKLFGRYLNLDILYEILLSEYYKDAVEKIGTSVEGRPIYKIKIGEGETKILAWSQMHGNESTTTKAVFDVLNYLKKHPEFLKGVALHIIPLLNPDGLVNYTRVNANGVDLNRDAIELSQPESKVLRKQFEEINPAYCFNLHDQRTIFSAGMQPKSAVVSFLSPAVNKIRSVNSTRKKAMQLIVGMNNALQNHIPAHVGRYDDAYNPNCVGDNFQSQDVPTVLFEAGHYPEDYEREETRKYIFLAILEGIRLIATQTYLELDYKAYIDIPSNQKLFVDVILQNVKINKDSFDLGLQFEEQLDKGELVFIPIIKFIDNIENIYAHKRIDIENQEIYTTKKLVLSKPEIGSVFNELSTSKKKISLK